ncbi:MAG: phosphatase [Thiotrichaceae bacterium]|nr:MAG: phosphatase [Thiotrichaceae bacterium]
MSIESITNFIQVSGRVASSGQPEERQFKEIALAGYKVVVNLAMANSENAIPEEGNMVAALKMTYIHIPVPFNAPDVDHLKNFIKIMNAISNQKVWVHCVVNYRVSAFLYQYQRLIHGDTAEVARKVMLPTWEPNEVWLNFLAISGDQVNINAEYNNDKKCK